MAPEEAEPEEKSYHDWLAEALARDEETWAALERQLSRLRLKRGEAGGGEQRTGY